MSKAKEVQSGMVECAICKVPITEENIGYHRAEFCKEVQRLPEVVIERFEVLKITYEMYAWLKRPRSYEDGRKKAKVYEIESKFRDFLATIIEYVYTAGNGWYNSFITIPSMFVIQILQEKPDDIRYAGRYSNRLETDVKPDFVLASGSWLAYIYFIAEIVKKQIGLDFGTIFIEMINLYADLVN